jgi:tRNA A37 methylthiotransferase MiaB
MLSVARDSAASFRRRFLGQTMTVLWEQATIRDGGHVWEGLTDNYIRTVTSSTLDLQNRLLPVHLTHEAEGAVTGELIGDAQRR